MRHKIVAYEIECDLCGQVEHDSLTFSDETGNWKDHIKWWRSCGWQIGKRDICPDCRKAKRK